MELTKLQKITKACDDKIADNITTLEVQNGVCDYFIIATARNDNHSRAIVDEVEKCCDQNSYLILGKEGYREGDWILLDVDDIIVHVFTENTRKYYDLERLWS